MSALKTVLLQSIKTLSKRIMGGARSLPMGSTDFPGFKDIKCSISTYRLRPGDYFE